MRRVDKRPIGVLLIADDPMFSSPLSIQYSNGGSIGVDITIRYATPADNGLLAELGARTFYDAYAEDNSPDSMALYMAASFNPEKQAAELADPSSVFLIAEFEGEAVGYARLKEGAPSAGMTAQRPIEIGRIYARTEWIGRGVGSALMRACLEEGVKRECDTMWLSVWERNPRAQTFYRRWGFVEAGTQAFQLGDELQQDLLMRRPVKMG